jgi:rubrerythrin
MYTQRTVETVRQLVTKKSTLRVKISRDKTNNASITNVLAIDIDREIDAVYLAVH